MKKVAAITSYIFHPLLFPSYGTIFIILANPNLYEYPVAKVHIVWMIIVFALTFMFPVIWLAMMKGLEMIEDFKLQTSKERIIPFVATITFYLWCAWMFKPSPNMKIPPNQMIFYMMLGACISTFIAFFINTFSKISLHALGVANFVGLTLIMFKISTFDLRLVLLLAILVAGFVGTARLILKTHVPREIYIGYFVGFTGQFVAYSIVPLLL